jgi:hypothetical protein
MRAKEIVARTVMWLRHIGWRYRRRWTAPRPSIGHARPVCGFELPELNWREHEAIVACAQEILSGRYAVLNLT